MTRGKGYTIKLTSYICSICGKSFIDWDDCEQHIEKCDKCRHCKSAYFVYGVDFECEYSKLCDYPEWQYYKEERRKKHETSNDRRP